MPSTQNASTNGGNNVPNDYSRNWINFTESILEDQRLNRVAVCKALDIPVEPVRDLTVTNTSKGISGWAMAAVAGSMLLGGLGGGMGLVSLLNNIPQPPAATTPIDPQPPQVIYRDKQVDVEVIPPPGN